MHEVAIINLINTNTSKSHLNLYNKNNVYKYIQIREKKIDKRICLMQVRRARSAFVLTVENQFDVISHVKIKLFSSSLR